MHLVAVQIMVPHPPSATQDDTWQIVLMFAGVLLTAYGLVVRSRARRWRTAARPATGRVIDLIPQPARLGLGRTAWAPLIEFEADGRTVIFRSPRSAPRRRWPLDGPVRILYDGADPHRAGLAEAGTGLPWSLIAGVVLLTGFFAVVVG